VNTQAIVDNETAFLLLGELMSKSLFQLFDTNHESHSLQTCSSGSPVSPRVFAIANTIHQDKASANQKRASDGPGQVLWCSADAEYPKLKERLQATGPALRNWNSHSLLSGRCCWGPDSELVFPRLIGRRIDQAQIAAGWADLSKPNEKIRIWKFSLESEVQLDQAQAIPILFIYCQIKSSESNSQGSTVGPSSHS
jgi:hypothetical protein